MNIIINKNLNLKLLDYVLLQSICEVKLNRNIENNNNIIESFYNKYIINNKVVSAEISNLFKVSVGSLKNLKDSEKDIIYDSNSYEGGAGTFTKITETQAEYFLSKYEILDYQGNDESGFSATVFKNKETHEVTISFRSTEFIEDYKRDTTDNIWITGYILGGYINM